MFKNLIVILIGLFLVSCAGIGGMVGGSIKTYSGDYLIELNSNVSDVANMFEIISEIGKAMSLDIAGIDRAHNTIVLAEQPSFATAMAVGKTTAKRMTIIVNSKKLHIGIVVSGNFSSGTKKVADKMFNEFENKLMEKIK